jgi:hypothetical protein
LVPFLSGFLGCIFDLFLDAALLVRDVFHGVLCDWTPVFGPFLDLFWTVLFIIRRFLSLRRSPSSSACVVCFMREVCLVAVFIVRDGCRVLRRLTSCVQDAGFMVWFGVDYLSGRYKMLIFRSQASGD